MNVEAGCKFSGCTYTGQMLICLSSFHKLFRHDITLNQWTSDHHDTSLANHFPLNAIINQMSSCSLMMSALYQCQGQLYHYQLHPTCHGRQSHEESVVLTPFHLSLMQYLWISDFSSLQLYLQEKNKEHKDTILFNF